MNSDKNEKLKDVLEMLTADNEIESIEIKKKFHRDDDGEHQHDGYVLTVDFIKL